MAVIVAEVGRDILVPEHPVVRHGRIVGCRRESRSALLIVPAVKSFAVGLQALYSMMGRYRYLPEVQLGALGFAADAVRQVVP